MARRTRAADAEKARDDLLDQIRNFDRFVDCEDLRRKVKYLVSANYALRDLGISLVGEDVGSARHRILWYLQQFSGQVIDGDELMVISGISEYGRRVRELRVEFGWPIFTGATIAELRADAQADIPDDLAEIPDMRPDQYMLQAVEQDREAAFRWRIANEIRKSNRSVRDKLLDFFRRNVGQVVTGEELRYVASNRSEWARRTRELRTEHGWPVITRHSGGRDLPIGSYVLERDQQAPPHDRKITEHERRRAMQRDGYRCKACAWEPGLWNRSDPRYLEAHHIVHHVHGGGNNAENLITYCNLCHDEVHRRERISTL